MSFETFDVDGDVIHEWCDRPAGEIAPGIVPDTTIDLYIVCWCQDGTHPEREFAMRQTWGDGHYVITPAWHTDRAAAVADHTFAHGDRHIVTRRVRIVQEVA